MKCYKCLVAFPNFPRGYYCVDNGILCHDCWEKDLSQALSKIDRDKLMELFIDAGCKVTEVKLPDNTGRFFGDKH